MPDITFFLHVGIPTTYYAITMKQWNQNHLGSGDRYLTIFLSGWIHAISTEVYEPRDWTATAIRVKQ